MECPILAKYSEFNGLEGHYERGKCEVCYGVLESNLLFRQKNRIYSQSDHNSGGTQWFLTPGLQYVTRRWVLEAAVQIPVVQQLNGTALENDTIVRTGFRFNF